MTPTNNRMEWKAEYAIILFLAFAGVTYRLTQGGGDAGDSIGRRLYAQFYAFLLTSVICIGLLSMVWGWHFVVVCLLTLLLAPISEKFIFLWTQSQNSSKGIGEYIKRFWQTYQAMKNNPTSSDEGEQIEEKP